MLVDVTGHITGSTKIFQSSCREQRKQSPEVRKETSPTTREPRGARALLQEWGAASESLLLWAVLSAPLWKRSWMAKFWHSSKTHQNVTRQNGPEEWQ